MFSTVQNALSHLKSGANVYIHTAAAAPTVLIEEMVRQADRLQDVQLFHLHTEGPAPYLEDKYEGIFQAHVFFIGANCREAVRKGRAAYIPVFLSEIPQLFRRKIIPLNAALISVSPPDQHGYCSLGVSVDAAKAAIEMSDLVIAQVNRFMPRTHGDSQVHVRDISFLVEGDVPLHEAVPGEPGEISKKIGTFAANLVENQASIQMGIGEIPNAVLAALHAHKDLGIHTEMFSDGILPLVESGVINGKFKKKYRNKIVSTFLMGSRKLYDFVDDNPIVAMLDCSYVNDTSIIRQNPKTTAINSAIEIDLTGQVCADSIGTRMYSGVGGQMDFIRGASLSEGGKAIIALPSVTSRGESRIVPFLKEGAGVVTTRAHIHYVVTEYGVAYLYGKDLKQRAFALAEIAHPDHRERLLKAAHERLGSLKSWV
jgi:acyl-CoA hydrolase